MRLGGTRPTASVMTDTECAGRSTMKLGPAVTPVAVTFTASGLEKPLAAGKDPAVSVSIRPPGRTGTPVTVIVVRSGCVGLVLTALR